MNRAEEAGLTIIIEVAEDLFSASEISDLCFLKTVFNF